MSRHCLHPIVCIPLSASHRGRAHPPCGCTHTDAQPCRENNTGRFPRGLSLMLRSMSTWIYDRDPFQPLKWEHDLEHLKQRLAAKEDIFG